MADGFFDKVYNPDVLSCLANLSNDEVFTPPDIANQMLDMLPQELFQNPDTTFLDPACKSGVFLREIAKRLIIGLEPQFPDLQERVDHIFHKQLFGIAITELTSLLSRRSVYCSKYPNGEFSVSQFDSSEGNIRFRDIKHAWDKSGKCVFCGASKDEYERGNELESYAYEWIHTIKPEEIFNMHFDVIISNPPYQLSDGGGTGTSAKPIYQLFVEQAKKLSPSFLSMIIPSRWFSGGKGLDDFRASMLDDKHIKKLVDYENYKEVFSGLGGLAGGACYFLWDKDYKGECEVVNFSNGVGVSKIRSLSEYDIFIRSNNAIDIIKKIEKWNKSNQWLSDTVSVRLPFGIPTTYKPVESGVPCYFTQKMGIQFVKSEDVTDTGKILDKYKMLVPKAPIAGQTDFSKPIGFYYDGNTRIAKPGECCSESWLVAGAFDTEDEAISFKSYLLTKTVRFLLLQTVVSQNTSRKNFRFIPAFQSYDGIYTDELLKNMWGITDEEWKVIDSKICEIGGDSNA